MRGCLSVGWSLSAERLAAGLWSKCEREGRRELPQVAQPLLQLQTGWPSEELTKGCPLSPLPGDGQAASRRAGRCSGHASLLLLPSHCCSPPQPKPAPAWPHLLQASCRMSSRWWGEHGNPAAESCAKEALTAGTKSEWLMLWMRSAGLPPAPAAPTSLHLATGASACHSERNPATSPVPRLSHTPTNYALRRRCQVWPRVYSHRAGRHQAVACLWPQAQRQLKYRPHGALSGAAAGGEHTLGQGGERTLGQGGEWNWLLPELLVQQRVNECVLGTERMGGRVGG